MPRQLAFDLPANVRLGAEDFFVSVANEQAFAMIEAPETWPDGKLAIVGPAACGKSHLAGLFAASQGATVLKAGEIDPTAPMPATALVVDDGEALLPAAEEWLFHAHNHLRAEGRSLLLTGRTPPARWDIALPDLASRLSAATIVTIDNPDEDLLLALLLKQFQDRQLAPTPDVIAYLHRHLDRSFEAIRDIVALLDQEALAQGKRLTRPFVREVLDSSDRNAR